MKQFSIVIAGGGSTYTPDMLEMLCLVREHFPLRRVVLYDNDAERQEHIGRSSIQQMRKPRLRILTLRLCRFGRAA